MSISIEHSSLYNKHCLFQWHVYQDNFVRFTGVLPLFFFVLFKYLQTVFMSKMFSQRAFNQCLMQHISLNPFCLPNRNGLLLRYVTVINTAVSLTSPDLAKHLEITKNTTTILVLITFKLPTCWIIQLKPASKDYLTTIGIHPFLQVKQNDSPFNIFEMFCLFIYALLKYKLNVDKDKLNIQ